MKIQCFISDLLASNMYIITDNNHAIIIDPCQVTDCYVMNCSYDYIFLTHEHYDHISGVDTWKKLTKAIVLCSETCATLIEDPKKNFSRHFKEFASLQTIIKSSSVPESKDYSCKADEIFTNETCITWEGHKLQLFETPGHSSGSSCLLIDDQYLFSGDTVLHNYETALRFPGGSRKKWDTITKPKLDSLAGSILVYPGHFEAFTMRDWIGRKND